jgi:hypothetical protein
MVLLRKLCGSILLLSVEKIYTNVKLSVFKVFLSGDKKNHLLYPITAHAILLPALPVFRLSSFNTP